MTNVAQGTTSSYTFTGPDSVYVALDAGEQANVRVAPASGPVKYGCAFRESRTIGPFATGDVLTVTALRGAVDYTIVPNSDQVLSGAYTLTAKDDQKQYWCSVALTITIPDGLSPRPVTTVVPPPSGNLTVAMGGSETLNGAGTSLTRTRASNVGGVVIQGYRDSAAYGLTGS